MKSIPWLVLTWRVEQGIVGSSSRRTDFQNFILSTRPNWVMSQDENNKESEETADRYTSNVIFSRTSHLIIDVHTHCLTQDEPPNVCV